MEAVGHNKKGAVGRGNNLNKVRQGKVLFGGCTGKKEGIFRKELWGRGQSMDSFGCHFKGSRGNHEGFEQSCDIMKEAF